MEIVLDSERTTGNSGGITAGSERIMDSEHTTGNSEGTTAGCERITDSEGLSCVIGWMEIVLDSERTTGNSEGITAGSERIMNSERTTVNSEGTTAGCERITDSEGLSCVIGWMEIVLDSERIMDSERTTVGSERITDSEGLSCVIGWMEIVLGSERTIRTDGSRAAGGTNRSSAETTRKHSLFLISLFHFLLLSSEGTSCSNRAEQETASGAGGDFSWFHGRGGATCVRGEKWKHVAVCGGLNEGGILLYLKTNRRYPADRQRKRRKRRKREVSSPLSCSEWTR